MPRKSAASHLALVNTEVQGVERISRIPAPPKMAPAVRVHWIEIVGSLAAAHFRPSDGPLLARYCELITLAESPDLSIDDLLKVARTMSSLAVKLRLAPSTRGHARTTARQKMTGRDWEADLDD